MIKTKTKTMQEMTGGGKAGLWRLRPKLPSPILAATGEWPSSSTQRIKRPSPCVVVWIKQTTYLSASHFNRPWSTRPIPFFLSRIYQLTMNEVITAGDASSTLRSYSVQPPVTLSNLTLVTALLSCALAQFLKFFTAWQALNCRLISLIFCL